MYNTDSKDSLHEVAETLAVYGKTNACTNEGFQHLYQSKDATSDREAFRKYYHEWSQAARVFSGFPSHIAHPAFEAIVNMGVKAIPFIREILPTDRSYIIKALEQIIGPLPAEWRRCSSHTAETTNIQGIQFKIVPPISTKEAWMAYLKNYSTISRN